MATKTKKKPQAVADTSGMDPEMRKTLTQEVGRRDKMMRRFPVAAPARKRVKK